MLSPMEPLNNGIINQKNILSIMKQSRIYWHARKEVLAQIYKNKNASPTVEEVMRILEATQNQQKINGLINNCLQKSTKRIPIEQDPNPEIDNYRVRWSDLMVKEFNNMSSKMIKEEEYDEEDESVAYIYDSSALLQFLCSIKTKNSQKTRDSPIFLFPEDIIKVSKYTQVRSKYSFLLFQQNIQGAELDNDLREREKKGKKIADGQNISNQVEQYLCFGCVTGERVNVYKRYFECFYEYSGKRVQFNLYQKIWKSLIRSDMVDVMNSEMFFVFKQEILKMFKIFICDRQIAQMVKIRQVSPSQAQKLDKYSPIHNILPCKSFSMYMAPFCYASTDVEDIYEVFQQVYANCLSNLNVISSHSDTILPLCILFEQMLWSTQKKLVQKFQQLHIQPTRLVFPWIFYCFINYIEVEQFFLLLDRIIGAQSLQILPLYCVSIMFKQKTAILQAKTQTQIQQILQDSLKEDVWIQTIRDYFKYHL